MKKYLWEVLKLFLVVVLTFIFTISSILWFFGLSTRDIGALFNLVRTMKIIRTNFVGGEVTDEKMLTGALKGIVASLDDPYSIYMDEKFFKEFMTETTGSFSGVGLVLGIKDKVLTVIAPIEGTPGERAGVRSGDKLIKIDGQDASVMTIEEAVAKIRGKEGTLVSLSLLRTGEEEKEYKLVRENIKIKTVHAKLLENGIGYIRISMFNENTGKDFTESYLRLKNEGMKKIILDLRDNPGGLLEESVKVASYFVPEGPVVEVDTRDGKKEVHYAKQKGERIPCVVLVNLGSASASEIVAGAIQDTKTGKIIGEKTFGKGSVQTVYRLVGGAGIKMTIAKYLTPNGRSLIGNGIEPDLKVENPKNWYLNADDDLQLKKAKESLQ